MQHIGFIMDGNRRWAKKLGNVASFGHQNGFKKMENVFDMCLKAEIPYVSMWGLSKENITERSEEEIKTLFTIIRTQILSLGQTMKEKSIRFEIVWDLWLLPADVREVLLNTIELTKEGVAMTTIFAVAYSGQDEIVRWIRRCMREGIDPENLTEKEFLQYIDTGSYPPPNVIVRTGGYVRHSGYFLYQSAYSEYFFTDTLWPDFSQKDFDAVIDFYSMQQRNFGK